jgi:hypothetical protein
MLFVLKSPMRPTLFKKFALALLDQDCDKILVGIELDALATARAQTRAACRWAACEKANPENSFRQSAFNTPFNQYTPDSRLRERLCQS